MPSKWSKLAYNDQGLIGAVMQAQRIWVTLAYPFGYERLQDECPDQTFDFLELARSNSIAESSVSGSEYGEVVSNSGRRKELAPARRVQ